jgi:hypothetical protein
MMNAQRSNRFSQSLEAFEFLYRSCMHIAVLVLPGNLLHPVPKVVKGKQ